MTEIIPAVMPSSFADLTEKIGLVAHYVPCVQVDVMDGKFVPSRSWPYYTSDKKSFEDLLAENSGFPYWDQVDFEADLMVENPETVIDNWISIGAARLIIHIESTKQMKAIVNEINSRFSFPVRGTARDVELGIALSPGTPTDTITEYLEDVDFVQFMGIERIGFQKQPFDERVIPKIREFHNAHPEIPISVDGGVTLDNARELVEVGVTRLVSGSGIFASGNIADTIELMKKIAH